jgi:cytidylate kinase
MFEGALEHQRKIIAIDGPVAAGKTVVGRALAQRLGYTFLDTGIMYRALTWLALHNAVDLGDESQLGYLAHNTPIRPTGRDSDTVLVGDHQLRPELRSPEVDLNVSLVSKVSAVRRAMVEQQRQLAAEGGMVMVGRDIGTVVLPNADLKLFMCAPVEARAQRRWRELQGKGHPVALSQVLQETRARDEIDSHRDDSPLTAAEDSLIVETGHLTVEQVVEQILEQVYQQLERSET